ncbi:2-amino-4-hydroxy-6-hydroxymethyldihydropteridine diphosphokinase [Alphaproteobacteria bacterium]|nr:2-amino-4-hydroxy-6-hydroxymethyldihydropteridine diphosphokinase [Alphaproteobacteria bacterium]
MNKTLIGIGANLIPEGYSTVQQGLDAAIHLLDEYGLKNIKCSSWYETSPVPKSDQPLYRNAVLSAETSANPLQLLQHLNQVEARIGRVRTVANAPRVLDLDILDFNADKIKLDNLVIPHPRMHLRAFVLVPLSEICPEYFHPVTKQTISTLIKSLPDDQMICKLTA